MRPILCIAPLHRRITAGERPVVPRQVGDETALVAPSVAAKATASTASERTRGP